jgi:hypothetical protein
MNLPEKTALAGFGMGALMCLLIWQPWKPTLVPPKPVDLAPLQVELHELREAVTAQASARCMTVNTPILNITVYDVPNLGKQKMPPTSKPATKLAEVEKP